MPRSATPNTTNVITLDGWCCLCNGMTRAKTFLETQLAYQSRAEEFCWLFADYFSPSFNADAGFQDSETMIRAELPPAFATEFVNVLVGWRNIKNTIKGNRGIVNNCQLPTPSPTLRTWFWIPHHMSQRPMLPSVALQPMDPQDTFFNIPGAIIFFDFPGQNMRFRLGFCQIGIGRTSALC